LLTFAGAWISGLGACASGESPTDDFERSLQLASRDLISDGMISETTTSLGTTATPLPASDGGTASDARPDAGVGPSLGNDCCTATGSGGCNDDTVEACVCAGDPFCCEVEYDALCARQAVSRCGLDCDDRAPVSDCCGPSDVPGCTQPEVEACICEIDPFCCVFRFDQSCVNLGIARCNIAGGDIACESDRNGRDEPSGETGEEVQP
jgi:hypothetical protein